MKRIRLFIPFSVFGLALGASALAFAQEDGSQIILPLEAQTCDLPSAPSRIPEEATYEELVAAKGRVSDFQAELAVYRECLENAAPEEELTEGNRIALNQAHNYSVEMEERVAEAFNTAVRAYKAREAEGG
ncbi:MAG: hypothetical protein V2I57_04245 [Xanthomonadales bacterium]|jgi:hypothetical protein|nr:hypothetical protein [Xanthomonadales bacterium]